MSVAHATQTTDLGDLRDLAAAALAPVVEGDPSVLVDVVDAVTPPALMLLWGDPWLAPGVQRAMGGCILNARLHVLCIAGRLEPGPGVRVIEGLVSYAVARLAASAYTWPLESVSAPRVFDLGGVAYLGARVSYLTPVSVGGTSV